MKMLGTGFFMVEFLVYFFLCTCLAYCVVHFIVASSLHMCREHKRIGAITELLTALDYCGLTLENAPCDKKLWKKMECSCLIWHDNDAKSDKGIYLVNDKLICVQGTYSLFKEAWITKKKTTVAKHIKSVEFKWHEDKVANKKNIRSLECVLKGELPYQEKEYTVRKSVALENRILI